MEKKINCDIRRRQRKDIALQRFEEGARGKSRGVLAMKFPKKTNRYCPFCNEKTEHKIKLVSTGARRGTLTRGSISRARARGLGRGMGNLGKWGSKPAVSKFKRKTKTNKKTNILYTCTKCSKSHYRKGRRNKRTGKQLQE